MNMNLLNVTTIRWRLHTRIAQWSVSLNSTNKSRVQTSAWAMFLIQFFNEKIIIANEYPM